MSFFKEFARKVLGIGDSLSAATAEDKARMAQEQVLTVGGVTVLFKPDPEWLAATNAFQAAFWLTSGLQEEIGKMVAGNPAIDLRPFEKGLHIKILKQSRGIGSAEYTVLGR